MEYVGMEIYVSCGYESFSIDDSIWLRSDIFISYCKKYIFACYYHLISNLSSSTLKVFFRQYVFCYIAVNAIGFHKSYLLVLIAPHRWKRTQLSYTFYRERCVL